LKGELLRASVLIGIFMLVSVACSSSAADPGEAALDQIEGLTGLRADLGWSVQEVLLSDDGDCAAVDLVTDNGMEAGVSLAKTGGRWVGVSGDAGVGHVAAHRIGLFEFGDDCEAVLSE
jgi:hypothetical protein